MQQILQRCVAECQVIIKEKDVQFGIRYSSEK